MKRFLLSIILLSSIFTLNSFAQTRLSGGQAYGWYVIDPVSISGTPDFADVFFIDDNLGWITSPIIYNEIYKTTDGASSFSTQTTPLGATTAIHMLDADNGYSGGEGGWVYKADDGSLNWNFLASIGSLLDISFPFGPTPANPIGYASGDNGRVWEITSTLTNLNSPSSEPLRGISAPSVNNVWVCGGSSIFYYNGTSFIGQGNPTGTFNDIHIINNLEGWVVGNVGVIGHTTDGGSTWAVNGAGLTNEALSGVHFTSTTNGYLVGTGKTIIKFGEITSIEKEEELPTDFSLSQNYPNPFNPSTKIKFRIPLSPPLLKGESEAGGFITLKVYDVLGNEMATLVNEELNAGEYEIEFPCHSCESRNLSSGIYFYQLKAGSFIHTKKMLLLK